MAWHQYIPNDVGHDEYLQWAEKIGTQPMYTINLGTGTLLDAIHIAEYTNHSGGTYWSDLRRQYGREQPYGVKTWYLGNEMDGPLADSLLGEGPQGATASWPTRPSKAMKWVDGSIETAVCGSSLPLYGALPPVGFGGAAGVLQRRGTMSRCTTTTPPPPGNYFQLLGGAAYIEDYIETEAALCDFVQAKMRSPPQADALLRRVRRHDAPPPGHRAPRLGPL